MEEIDIHPQVKYLLGLPQHEQRSKEWFEKRKNRLTSSDIDTVLGNSKYSKAEEVLFKKCGISKPFTGNKFTEHGQKYEDEAIAHYCKLYNKKNYSFGLLPHPTIPWLGGSPDDITHDGIVLEVKCPYTRKIEMGKIPGHYIAQVKMNMEICDLEKAVFIEYRPANFLKEGDEMVLNVVEVDRDREWAERVIPILDTFWKSVLYYRENGIETHPNYEYWNNKTKPKKVFDVFSNETSEFKEIIDSEDEN